MDTDHIMSGLYNGSEYIMITVTDESGDVIWQSDDDFEFEEIEDIYQYNDDNYLLVEDYQKGNFFIYTLETLINTGVVVVCMQCMYIYNNNNKNARIS